MTIAISLTTLKRSLYFIIAIGAIVVGATFAFAQEGLQEGLVEEDLQEEAVAKIQFPLAELGNCADKQACKTYCDQEENRQPCFAFAKKHGLMKQEKVRKIEKQMKALEQGGGGPGGCQSEKACENYCSDVAHIKECVEFGKKHGMMESRELEEAEKVLRALESGAKFPGNCRGKAECELYCSVPEHMEECLAFAEQAGFMDTQELAEAKRMLPLMKSGQTPGGCRSKGECEAYCEEEGNIEECIAFAEKTGLAKPEELEIMKKTGGRGPGGCRGRVACDLYCGNEEHAEECFKFAEEHGLIPPEELELIKKAGGVELLKKGGPGGCRGKRECEEFCGNPDNQEACFQFATEKGLISPEEIEKIKSMGGLQDFQGPGGCKGPRECEEYCSNEENRDECMRFAWPGEQRRGRPSGGQPICPAMPSVSSCTEGEVRCDMPVPEDCPQISYCAPAEQGCRNFGRSGEDHFGGPPPEFEQQEFGDDEHFFEDLEGARREGDIERVQKLEQMLQERRGEGQSRDEFFNDQFPGRGEPTDGFVPPPGFSGESGDAPPHREGGFQVPPGFVPPGQDQMRSEMSPELKEEMRERMLQERRERGPLRLERRPEEPREHFEEREAQFQDQLKEERFRQDVRRREEFSPSPERFMSPPDGNRPPAEGNFQPPPAETPPDINPAQDFSPPQSFAPQSSRALSRALSLALSLLLGN